MKKPLLIIFAICSVFIFSEGVSDAQLWRMRRWEATGGFGPSVFFGDIGGFSKTENLLGFKDASFLQTRFDLNLSFKYRI